jgi:hypothetical protein
MTAEQLWNAIEGVSAPPALEPPEFAVKQANALANRGPGAQFIEGLFKGVAPLVFGGFVAVVLGGFHSEFSASLIFLGLLTSVGIAATLGNSRGRYSRAKRAVRLEWEHAVSQWRATSSATPFSRARSKLEEYRRSFVSLGEQRKRELERLMQRFLVRQREDFLDKFEIVKAPLREVTRAQVDKLWSRGIRSAGDVGRHRRKMAALIPSAALEELHTWAAHCEQNFSFDVNEPSFSQEAAKIEDKFRKERQAILQQLRHGPALLSEKREEVAVARARAEGVLREAQKKLKRRRESQNEG